MINILKVERRLNEMQENKYWQLPRGCILCDKYLIDKVLGEGGFGITYLAWDINLKTQIAIKEYYPAMWVCRNTQSSTKVITSSKQTNACFDEGLHRYVHEAQILTKFFDLPGIVSIKDFFYENNTAYIVMEYVDGMSLSQCLQLKGNQLPYDEALKLMEPVICSLSVIHKQGLLHRDISPDNIMIDKDGNVKLIDFGSARTYGDGESTKTVMVKHGYAPIEQYSSHGEQGVYSDIYALCAVLYRMITGVVPADAIQRNGGEELVPVKKLAKVPSYIDTIIMQGLSMSADDRPKDMDIVYQKLYKPTRSEKKAKDNPDKKVIAKEAKKLLKEKERKRKNRRLFWKLMRVLILIILIFLVLQLYRQHSESVNLVITQYVEKLWGLFEW